MFGIPETTPGGRALKFYSSVRLDVRKIENLKDGTDVVGSRTRVKVVKNKVAPPFRQCEFDIMYGKGISKEGSLLDVGVDLEIVKKSGAWFTYEGEQLGQGRENARPFLAEHIDLRDEIERKVREAVGLTAFADEDDEPDPDRARSGDRGRAGRDGRPAAKARRTQRRRAEARPRPPGGGPQARPKTLHERALGLLAVRQRSRRELERRLLQAGFEADEVADELVRLERVGLIDDEAFARPVAEHASARSEQGRRAVASTLLAAGVAPATAAAAVLDDAVGTSRSGPSELAAARAAAPGVAPDKAFARLYGLLVRRGFAPEVARGGPQSPCGGGVRGAEPCLRVRPYRGRRPRPREATERTPDVHRTKPVSESGPDPDDRSAPEGRDRHRR